ncbi:hypothetical protein K2173_010502 [Erythroxylum novogranatense]|uniref:Uncharacterized protein n=1 Tax=Erythroxylum novogranatense TaxID=1862640 RepID=A0AAV8TE86_9ROSI|nr:hypothetical protein K2173_010502 [Erythroxylum novogranatense]
MRPYTCTIRHYSACRDTFNIIVTGHSNPQVPNRPYTKDSESDHLLSSRTFLFHDPICLCADTLSVSLFFLFLFLPLTLEAGTGERFCGSFSDLQLQPKVGLIVYQQRQRA